MSLLPTPSIPAHALVRRSVTVDRLRDPHSALNQPSQDTVTNPATSSLRYNGDYLTFQSDYVLSK